MVRESKRGGKREGAGRKAGDGSTRVSIPNGCLPAVLQLITDYKAGNQMAVVPTVVPAMPDQVEMPFLDKFVGIDLDVLAVNRQALESIALYVEDLPGLLAFMKGYTSGQFRKLWDELPQSVKLKAIKKHKTPEGVYRAGGRVLPRVHPLVSPVILWL